MWEVVAMIKDTKKTKRKKPRRSKLIKDIDHLCSKQCSTNVGGICEVCSKIGTQTHHHFSKKAFPHLRFDMRNLIWLCFFCHIRKIHQQGQYELAREVLVKRFGEDGFSLLKRDAYQHYGGKYKVTIKDLDNLYKELSLSHF